MPSRPTRRAVLFGAGGLAVAGAAGFGVSRLVGGDDGEAGLGDDVVLGAFFGAESPFVAAGIEQRAVFGLLDSNGPVNAGSPDELSFTVTPEGQAGGDPLVVARHDLELPRPYYPVRFTARQPGTYVARTEVDGRALEAAFMVASLEQVGVPQVGDPLPTIPTPTTDQARGVDPICTRDPACPLHEQSLDQVLSDGRPVAVLVSTPAFCQTAICGPVLDVLLARRDEVAEEVVLLHAEVYTDRTAEQLTPAVQGLGLNYEPALFVAGADGILRARLDNIFDAEEMRAALALAVS